jgi:hypothetical protein
MAWTKAGGFQHLMIGVTGTASILWEGVMKVEEGMVLCIALVLAEPTPLPSPRFVLPLTSEVLALQLLPSAVGLEVLRL